MRSRWLGAFIVFGMLVGLVAPHRARAEEFALKSNESVGLFGVYWIANCKSILKSFGGVEVLEGPPEISLSLKPGLVRANRQKCARPVRGATVVAKAKAIASKTTAKLVFRVRYNTEDGSRQSTHTVTLDLYP